MTRRMSNTGPIVTKNSKHDDFILRHYRKDGWTAETIAAHLGIPKGSVITRYQLASGRIRSWDKERDTWGALPPPNQPGMPKLKFLGEK